MVLYQIGENYFCLQKDSYLLSRIEWIKWDLKARKSYFIPLQMWSSWELQTFLFYTANHRQFKGVRCNIIYFTSWIIFHPSMCIVGGRWELMCRERGNKIFILLDILTAIATTFQSSNQLLSCRREWNFTKDLFAAEKVFLGKHMPKNY